MQIQGVPTLWWKDACRLYEVLHLPSWEEYSHSVHQAQRLSYEAIRANVKLCFLTFQPFAIVLRYVFKVLLRYARVLVVYCIQVITTYIRRMIVFQSQLSWFVLGMELAAVLIAIAIYLLRRYIHKKRYVERIQAWHGKKKDQIQRKYVLMLENVARTSTTLAMMTPHILYLIMVIIGCYLISIDILLFIGNSWLLEVISVFIPTYQSVVAIEHNKSLIKELERYNEEISSREKRKPSKIQLKQCIQNSDKGLQYWLRYWITFTLIYGIGQLVYLIPLISRLSHAIDQRNKRLALIAVFGWLRYLPLPTPQNVGKAFGKHAQRYSSNTVDIVYNNLIRPFLLPLANAASEDHQMSGLIDTLVKNTEIFLAALVFMKGLSHERKEVIVHIFRESLALLPAFVSLLMPSMFTAYGCVYASSFVATTNSAKCDDMLEEFGKKVSFLSDDESKKSQSLVLRIRWLQYYCVYGNAIIVLRQIDYILSWIPLSKHAELLFLIWLQLPVYGGAHFCYRVLLTELIGFGVFEANKDFDANNTVTMRLLSRLPSSQTETDPAGLDGGQSEKNK